MACRKTIVQQVIRQGLQIFRHPPRGGSVGGADCSSPARFMKGRLGPALFPVNLGLDVHSDSPGVARTDAGRPARLAPGCRCASRGGWLGQSVAGTRLAVAVIRVQRV